MRKYAKGSGLGALSGLVLAVVGTFVWRAQVHADLARIWWWLLVGAVAGAAGGALATAFTSARDEDALYLRLVRAVPVQFRWSVVLLILCLLTITVVLQAELGPEQRTKLSFSCLVLFTLFGGYTFTLGRSEVERELVSTLDAHDMPQDELRFAAEMGFRLLGAELQELKYSKKLTSYAFKTQYGFSKSTVDALIARATRAAKR
jgi:hypothetical protein